MESRNTEAIAAQQRPRHTNDKKEAAVYKWGTAVLLELGTHQPLGAARALPQLDHAEGELNIARRVLGAMPRKEDTLLLDEKEHPASKLLGLYAQRWEQELFFGELKRHTGRYSLLRAGTLQGAQAEFGALIIAASLLAEQRLKAAQSVSLPPVRLSLGKISYMLQHLLSLLEMGADILSAKQRAAMIRKYLALMARESVIKPRRSRSCQRAVCKPQCSWPRIQSRWAIEGPFVFHVIAS